MRACGRCGNSVENTFRFCPWCAAPQRLKLTEHFPGEDGRALRVSRYLAPDDRAPHVRFSIWSSDGEARAVVSIDDDEAGRLAGFLTATAPPPTRSRRRRLGALIARG